MNKLQENLSWGTTFRLLAVASINLFVLAACQRPHGALNEGQFSTQIPNAALFDVDARGVRRSVNLRTGATHRGVVNEAQTTSTSDQITCQALIPECMGRRPHSMFVYLSNMIHTYYPQWNSFSYIRFGYGNSASPLSACTKGKWNIKVSGNTGGFGIVPVRYQKAGKTKVITNTRTNLEFDAETQGLAGLMLAFKQDQNADCRYYAQDASHDYTSNWYWRAPTCQTFAAPMITLTASFEPRGNIAGIRTTDLVLPACEAKTTFTQTLQFNADQLTYFTRAHANSNEIYGWNLKYENEIYHPYDWE